MSIQDTFLLDEVRCGFMVPSAIKQAWAAELEVLKEIDRVCRKHNIQYFADWGTLLGAVRHGGFIPWDDDLDIVMKREDYVKFMTVARYDMDEGFDVQTFRNHDDCWLFMGKVVGRNGFCFEKEHLRRFHNFPYIASVDIFVLDYVYRDPEKEEARRKLCKYMLAVADSIVVEGMTKADREIRLKMLEEVYEKKISRKDDPVEMRRYLYEEIETVFAEVPEQEADKLTQLFPWGLKGEQRHYLKECYDQFVEIPFEDILIPVPKMYEAMLRKRYKTYEKLIKTAGAHGYPFFEAQKENLQKVLDFELPEFKVDVAKLVRSKDEKVYRDSSYKAMTRECIASLGRMKSEVAQIIEHIAVNATLSEQVLDLLATSQQLAIDLGNMLEQFLGEGCSTILLLEQYCEALYKVYERVSAELDVDVAASVYKSMDIAWNTLIEDVKQNVFERKTVLFLPVLSRDWNGLHGLWESFLNDSRCDVHVVPLPYYYKDYDGSPKKVCCEVADFPKEVEALDYQYITQEYLEMLHPDVIVIQNPYDSWNPAISVPELFYSVNLRKYTDELIYVSPYLVGDFTKNNEREYFNMRYYVTMPGVVYSDRIVVQSENLRQVYIERLTEFVGDETENIWKEKVIVFEICDRKPTAEFFRKESDLSAAGEKLVKLVYDKKIIYAISLGSYISNINIAQDKIERNLCLFEECGKQIDLTLMVFPDSREADILREFIDRMLKKYPNVITKNGVYEECHAVDYDVYYGDVTPLIIEFRDMGKHVIIQDYCMQN